MPILFVTFSFAYLDRVNFSFAAAGGIRQDLHLSASDTSMVGAMFFLGYFSGQLPGAIYAERHSARVSVFVCLLLWGLLSAASGLAANLPVLLVVRFLLGFVEAGVFPALLVFISRWFAREERSLANSFVTLSTPVTVLWMSIASGYLVNAFGWRWMFIIEGLPASLWALGWWFLTQDRPSQARWLSQAQRSLVEERVAAGQVGLAPARNYLQALSTPLVLRLSTLYFFWGVALFGFILWLPTIIKGAGVNSIVETGWLSAGPYVLTAALMPVASMLSDRTADRAKVVWPFLAASGMAFVLLFLFPGAGFWPRYALICLAGLGPIVAIAPFFAIVTDRLPSNVAGGATAVVNGMGALGGFVGTYLVGLINELTHKAGSSFLLMGGALTISTLLLLLPSRRGDGEGRPHTRPGAQRPRNCRIGARPCAALTGVA